MKKRLFPFLIALSALAVSGSAAFYSVFGLSKLFAGASTEVIIMAGSLEFAKLVVASLLYQYWDTINKFLRFYLGIACFILILITSGGIYGFLSGAYQSTANQSELLDKSLIMLNQKNIRFQETKEDLKIEKVSLSKSISDLRIALSNPSQIQYIDKESGQLITTSSSSARRALQSELKTSIAERDIINVKTEAIMDSINKTDIALINKEVSNEAESELGPLKYLAETTGKDMNQVVNWFLLLIIFVFDPLAIALVVAANMAFAQLKKDDGIEMSIPDGMEFNTPYPIPNDWPNPSDELKERVSINQSRINDQEYSEDNWNTEVAKTPNPNSLIDKIEIEKKDIVMDDLENIPLEEEKILPNAEAHTEVYEGKIFTKSIDKLIDVIESEEVDQDPDEHELYHGVTRRGDSKKRIRKKVGDKKRIKGDRPKDFIKGYTNI